MAKAKKFGAFAGVYTPSLLTILGVIMYMRLGWVVGQAGLLNALVIILLAHVISVSTGLSVSSIATDKKIKAGGIYYILSRSLGLPMGGAIGITLFIGTALSISLYLVGFAENFLSIAAVRDFLGLEENRFGYQVVGTGAILMLVLIAFISTSLAIKTQYYILGAIGLSLVSIFAGFFLDGGARPEQVILRPAAEAIPLELIFAIFFPAVTGFTAGVAMSGDLKDPKRDIPLGTLSAIITGFVVYVVLAVGVAFFVNRDILLNDINYLMKVAWFSPLVIAGIWGATLSSALGGILGGPRILQAMASDRIGPRLFARGYGVNNEPRNALLFIFLIAEAGILIGELNVIAGIVSMFYLASYGFINIAYYLESWASADFRPTFRINRYIGLVGFIAAFGVMFKLDMLSMIAALVIMTGIYFFLKRKQLKLDYGDVWQSVWSSLMRTALEKMDNADEVERNWQPNIILFSGGTKKRPHLLSLGKCLVGRHGVLSNFDLIENKGAKVLFPKKNQSLPGEVSAGGVFTRRQTVKDIYEGIDLISRTYGFSGLEPNTVMLGWARQTRDPRRFAEMLRTLYDLDLNVLLLGYDKRVGFGKKQTIDIWFKDRSNHGNLALTLSKLLLLSDDWGQARVRVLIVNYLNEKSEVIYRKMDGILDNMRIDAEVKVINNQIERKPFYDIVETESAMTDLVFLEIPRIKTGREAEFIENTARLLDKIGTVMLIEASSSFKKLKIGLEEEAPEYTRSLQQTLDEAALPDVKTPAKPELADEMNALTGAVRSLMEEYHARAFQPLLKFRDDKTGLLRQAADKAFAVLREKAGDLQPRERLQLVSQLKSGLLVRAARSVEEQLKNVAAEREDSMDMGLDFFLQEVERITAQVPAKVRTKYTADDLQPLPDDPSTVRWFKGRKRLFRSRRKLAEGIPYAVNFQALCRAEFPYKAAGTLDRALAAFGQYNITYVMELQKLLYAISDAFTFLENQANPDEKMILNSEQNVQVHLDRLAHLNTEMQKKLPLSLLSETREMLNGIATQLARVPANLFIPPPPGRKLKERTRGLRTLPAKWALNHSTMLRHLHIEAQLTLAEHRMNKTVTEALAEIGRIIREDVLTRVDLAGARHVGEKGGRKKQATPPVLLSLATNQLQLNLNKVVDKTFRNIKATLQQMPESVEIFSEEAVNEITNNQFEEPETIRVQVFRLVDYYVQNELVAPMVGALNQLVKDIHDALTRIEDASRLLSLNAQSAGPDEGGGTPLESYGDLEGFLQEQKGRIVANRDRIAGEYENFRRQTVGNLSRVSRELHLFRLSKAAENSAVFSKKVAGKRMRLVHRSMERAREGIQKLRANLWYSQSKARLLARRISDGAAESGSVVDQVLNLKEAVTVNPGQLEKLPFYYQQLFLSKYNYQSEFWFGRGREMSAARRATSRFRAGHRGAIIITGERISGKSFFANHLVNESLQDHAVHTVTPPGAGSTDPAVFQAVLEDALERKGTPDAILDSLPERSVIILDDLELWWEKAPGGHALLGAIFDMVRVHSNKILFILAFGSRAFRIINRQVPFNDLALVTVQLTPFTSKELREVILFRHRTSGFKLSVDSMLPAGLSQAREARLFNRIFTFSGGNVGAALLCWIAGIKDLKQETIHVQSPRTPDLGPLDGLASEVKLYLEMFILHRKLSVGKLCRIMFEPDDKVRYVLQYMKRAGLLAELAEEVYEIDRYMHRHVARYLSARYDRKE